MSAHGTGAAATTLTGGLAPYANRVTLGFEFGGGNPFQRRTDHGIAMHAMAPLHGAIIGEIGEHDSLTLTASRGRKGRRVGCRFAHNAESFIVAPAIQANQTAILYGDY